MTAIMPSWPLGVPTRYTYWVSVLLRTRRTYGLTKNLQDQGDNLTLRNAHEEAPDSSSEVTTIEANGNGAKDANSHELDRAGTRHAQADHRTTPDCAERAAGIREGDR